MNVKIFITGIGFFSALGDLDSSWQSLLAGKSAIRLAQPFLELKPRPLAMIGDRPAELLTLTQLVVESALKDAGLNPPLPDCGVVIGSSRSQQARWEKFLQGSRGAGEQGGRGAEGMGGNNLTTSKAPPHPPTSLPPYLFFPVPSP